MGLFKGRLIALLAFTLVWSSAQCVALCANEPSASAGTGSAEPPCHHHNTPNSQTPASCSYQQLPQADVPRHLPALTSNAGLAVIDVAVVSLIQVQLLTAAPTLPMLDVLWPLGFAVPPVSVLRI
jgi:hypothetical protein